MAKAIWLLILFLTSSLHGSDSILFLMQKGKIEEGLLRYQEHKQQEGRHDFELLGRMAMALLEQGWKTQDVETQFCALIGAGIAMNDKVAWIVEEGIVHPAPPIQLVSLNFLALLEHERGQMALIKAMGSPLLPIKFEALMALVEQRHPKAFHFVESQIAKSDPILLPIFAPMLAELGDAHSIHLLKKWLHHEDLFVRVASILSVAQYGRDDLIPSLRKLSNHLEPTIQEASALSLGLMKDEASTPRFLQLSTSSSSHVQLAAFYALQALNKPEGLAGILNAMEAGNLFAIFLAGDIEGTEKSLVALLHHPDLQVRLNATWALLKQQHPQAIEGLPEFLLMERKGLVINRITSPGKAFSAWRAGSPNPADEASDFEVSLRIRELALQEMAKQGDSLFLPVARSILQESQNDLVPATVALLEMRNSAEAVEQLRQGQQKIGAPLVRHFCNLALLRLGESGPYAQQLREWLAEQEHGNNVQFRPLMPQVLREQKLPHDLTAQERSRLILEAYETFSERRDDEGIDVLLHAIQHGHPKARYALAGLLLRATQS